MDHPPTGGKPPERYSTRTWLALGLAATIAWAVFLATTKIPSGGMMPPNLESPSIHLPIDFAWELLDLDGKPVDFASYKGRPILLNLWATWCGPCLEEMPSIASLAANPRLKEKGVAFLCVSVGESPGALRRFVQGKPWTMTILRANSIPPAFTTDGIPATFLIAPDGRIAASQVGSAKWDDPSVVDFLEKLAGPRGTDEVRP